MLNDPFYYESGILHCEEAPLSCIAEKFGTPAYVYSKHAILNRARAYQGALSGLPHRVCYAVKANSNLAVLALLARERLGFDIVSGGELFRVLRAGADPSMVVFSGVGKTRDEIRYALDCSIHSFNCESETEIEWISQTAVEADKAASIAIRVNPDVNATTHPYISTGLREHKFGIDIRAADEIYSRAARLPGLRVEGVSCHIGSQLLDPDPLLEAAVKVLQLVKRLRASGTAIRYLDLGGGLGVSYSPGERAISISEFVNRLRSQLDGLDDLVLMLEPGRSIVAECGVLLTQVLLVKRNGNKTFAIVDAGMNDLIRPSLYQAHHEIVPVRQPYGQDRLVSDVVGPVCETGDFFARGRELPLMQPGDLLAIRNAGAYGFVQSSNYNSRPRVCELLIDGSHVHLARRREQLEDLIRGESA